MNSQKQVEVAVLGGGPAGIAAAISAARGGAKTILVERYGFLGGMSTAALVYPWMTFHSAAGEQVIRGIAQEIVDRLMALQASPGHLRDTVGFVHTLTPYNPEVYKVLACDMLHEAGVEVLLHTSVISVNATEGCIKSVLLHNKSGLVELKAHTYVDATGDGDIACLAGAPWEQGNDGHKVQPMTMKFRMRGVDLAKVKQYMQANPAEFYEKSLVNELDRLPLTGVMGFYSHWKAANLPIEREGLLFFTGPHEDEVLINVSRISGLDPTLAEDLTKAEIEGRKQVLLLEAFFRQHIPGFEQASVSAVGTQIGVRETRRILGRYVLSGEDVLGGRRFDDVIARSGYPIDIHNPEGKGVTANFIREGGAYDIPYRSIVPRQVDNLLLAGRCISTTHEAQATTRLTPSCMAIGQAAGAAAALAVRYECAAADVPVLELQQRLLKAGAELGIRDGIDGGERLMGRGDRKRE
ncbi:FAD dependent oxidoreductase [Paenibacillus sp. UNCCL117]|uniref:FAD-dependent oxidoreductase n=1 Tax=unclassified Paenibacillus TaxID=185978 RepID=UPI00087FD6B9|nr:MULTISPECIES: FAD-dependent oxidoreductase [unclassified Paenibacillus]SDD16795.1 FAD dependent oxidoreductase [Paenibacillus sp. cl123]SFW34812.1 FAD dependent oxidoreductase [Paenibacillus sp. UNCCL117]